MNLLEKVNEDFSKRHIGTKGNEAALLNKTGVHSIGELIDKTIPASIRLTGELPIPPAMSEADLLEHLKELAAQNEVFKSFIGLGYYDTITPSVILRNIFENPGWYTQYTPYQAEIAQGRLESLLNFQTMVSDLTALPIANASLLDEATAAAEAMSMFYHQANKTDKAEKTKFFADDSVFPQTLELLLTRAEPLNIEIVTGNYQTANIDSSYFGAIIQYPGQTGSIEDYTLFIEKMHSVDGYVAMATDLLALTLLTPPGELGADVALGSAQRFGVPMGYGGPHAAFFCAKDEFKRSMPGRIIGISVDAQGNRALRMALQTREQHIKREKATSNICTAQALLANMAAMYAVYHGPQGLKEIAERVALLTHATADALKAHGFELQYENFFDTISVKVKDSKAIQQKSIAKKINLRITDAQTIGISFDETKKPEDIYDVLSCFVEDAPLGFALDENLIYEHIPSTLIRKTGYLSHPNFNRHHSESRMMRYIKHLENKDLSLNTSMISLGSCTMKLNAATEMIPVSWEGFSKLHPFAPAEQTKGYEQIIRELEQYLNIITGFDACSMQPNSGAQGEYAGLLTIRNYHIANGDQHRNIILIPISAHGTNPASAVMAGMKVVVVKALENGYIDVEDFKAKATEHAANLAGTMITYPSTYGIFEESVKEICDIVHQYGGQVYMDGANMNAQVGLTSPGMIGADVCHLNLHKTFAIPHGGGGPGMGPICVRKHLAPHLPGHFMLQGSTKKGAVSAAPYGSASILLISYAYIRLLGAKGIKEATEYAILNANYMKARLEKDYEILYTGSNGTCAHEFIVDLRPFKTSAGIEAEDVAKRLMDYGFHAPTMSFPVPGTIMIEPTESEDKDELDRFCDALLNIRDEIRAIEEGKVDKQDNPLKNAPHTQQMVIADEWTHPYSRKEAAYPLYYTTQNKFWPSVARVNNTQGDRNLICTCEPVSSYA
ncbi:MAG: aminomethyl-transferring glycine dehydrogenase [Bacteroidota bacterium]